MNTLKDYISHDLKILSIGLNPSTISVQNGFYFANPRNRFWRALNASNLLEEELIPSEQSQEILFTRYKIGFTDVVKRHSSMGKDLKASDFKKYAPALNHNIKKYAPKICWFHGKVAIKKFLNYSGVEEYKPYISEIDWGKQKFNLHQSWVFVSPNPSPANAAFSLNEITSWYRKLYNLIHGVSINMPC